MTGPDELENEAIVHLEAGRNAEALAVVGEMQRAFPASSIDGWHLEARLLVRLGRRSAALERLEAAVDHGDIWRPRRLSDADYAPLREEARFRAVVDRALAIAADRQAEPRLFATPARRPRAPLLLVFHGAASTAEPEVAHWSPASGLDYTVAALQSSQPAGPGVYCWDDPERATQDVRWALLQLPERGRVVLGGFSQGARLALRLALEGSVAQPGGVVLVAPSLVEPLPPSARRLRVAILLGSEDAYAARSEPALRELERRGHHLHVERIDGLGHEYPADFGRRLPGLLQAATRRS